MTASTPEAIYRAYEERAAAERPRPYLGASSLGDPCHRRLWYGFRFCTPSQFSGRILRLFDTGHREEPRVFADLRAIGCEVWDRDPSTNGQFAIAPLVNGHVRGHADAVVTGLPELPDQPVLVDVKTISTKKLDRLKKHGLFLEYPKYYAQGQLYMAGLELEKAAYLFVAKDTDELHLEVFDFDADDYAAIIRKAEGIVASDRPPIREWEGADNFNCRFCDHKALCYGEEAAEVNCRTCVHATPVADGKWQCELWNTERTLDEQLAACDAHLFIPELVGFGEPVDAGKQWVLYRHRDTGCEFKNVPASPDGSKAAGEYTSHEIHTASALLGDAGLDDLRTTFDGELIK